MTVNTPAAELKGISKSFDSRNILNDVSFSVDRAEILAILGPNGAGKTTCIEICEGFIDQDSGSVEVLGLNPSRQGDTLRSRIGIMLQGGGAYPGIKTRELLELCASYYQHPLDPEWLINTLGLGAQENTPYRRLSGGQQQRLSLACALVGRPEMIFLDEPTAGLDAQSKHAVWDLIQALQGDGVTIILTTHMMDEAEKLADRVLILDHGEVVAQGDPSSLVQGSASLVVIKTADPLELSHLKIDELSVRSMGENYYECSALTGTVTPAHIAEVASMCAAQGVLITSLNVDHPSLESTFLDITGKQLRS